MNKTEAAFVVKLKKKEVSSICGFISSFLPFVHVGLQKFNIFLTTRQVVENICEQC
jgi:hypothetical protein